MWIPFRSPAGTATAKKKMMQTDYQGPQSSRDVTEQDIKATRNSSAKKNQAVNANQACITAPRMAVTYTHWRIERGAPPVINFEGEDEIK